MTTILRTHKTGAQRELANWYRFLLAHQSEICGITIARMADGSGLLEVEFVEDWRAAVVVTERTMSVGFASFVALCEMLGKMRSLNEQPIKVRVNGSTYHNLCNRLIADTWGRF